MLAAVALVSGCTQGAPDARPTPTATSPSASPSPLPFGSVTVEPGPRVRIGGAPVNAARSGSWLAWGAAKFGEDAHYTVALDLRSGVRRTYRPRDPKTAVITFGAGGGRFVIRETDFLPLGQCTDGGQDCVAWRLTLFDPASGTSAPLSASDRPRSQDFTPDVRAAGGVAVWQEFTGHGVLLRVLRPGSTVPRTVRRTRYASSGVSVVGDDVILDDTDHDGLLMLRVSTRTGRATVLLTGYHFRDPVAGPDFVAWVGGPHDSRTVAYLAPLPALRPVRVLRTVPSDQRIDWLLGGGGSLLVAGLTELWLFHHAADPGSRPVILKGNLDFGVGFAFADDGTMYYGRVDSATAKEAVILTA